MVKPSPRILFFVLIVVVSAHSQPKSCSVVETGGTLKQVRKILQEAVEATEQAEDESRKPLLLSPFAAAYARAGDVEAALEISRKFDNPSERFPVLLATVRAQARFGDVPGALHTASFIGDNNYRAIALQIVSSAQVVAGDISGSLQTAHSISDQYAQTKGEALARVGGWQGMLGDPVGASATLDQAENLVGSMAPGVAKVETLLRIAGERAGLGDEVGRVRIIHRALELASSLQDKYERTMSLYRIGLAQAAARDFEGAIRTSERIDEDALRDGVLHRILGVQHPIRDINVLHDVFRLVAMMRTDSARDRALVVIAHEQVYAENLKAASETVAKIRDNALKSRVQESLLSLPNRKAEEILDKCLGDTSEEIRVNPQCTDEQLTQVYFQVAKEGSYDIAIKIARAIENVSFKSQAFRHIASIQAGAGDWQAALAWARSEPSPSLKAYALLGIVQAMLSCLRPETIARPPKSSKN